MQHLLERGEELITATSEPVEVEIRVGLDGGFFYYVPSGSEVTFDRLQDGNMVALFQDPDGKYVDIEVWLGLDEFELVDHGEGKCDCPEIISELPYPPQFTVTIP